MVDLAPGAKLARFVLEKQIGKGASGVVFLARDTLTRPNRTGSWPRKSPSASFLMIHLCVPVHSCTSRSAGLSSNVSKKA